MGVTAVEVIQLSASSIGIGFSGWAYLRAMRYVRRQRESGVNGLAGYSARVRKRREGTRLLKHSIMFFAGLGVLLWRLDVGQTIPLMAIYSRNVTLTIISCLITKETIADFYDQRHMAEMDEADYQRGLKKNRRATDPKDDA